jgi:hypothetical protein
MSRKNTRQREMRPTHDTEDASAIPTRFALIARCVWSYPHILARGPLARPRCIPQLAARLGIEPCHAVGTFGRSTTARGEPPRSPKTPMAVVSPPDHDHAYAAWTRAREILLSPRPHRPRSLRCPLEPTSRTRRFPSPPAPDHGRNPVVRSPRMPPNALDTAASALN